MNKKILAMLLATVSSSVAAQSVNSIYFIGDSLTDSGQFGSRFTTNPGQVWSQYLAQQLGVEALPSSQGGTNFAVGGARVAVGSQLDPLQPPGPMNPPVPAMTDQLTQILAVSGGRLDQDALYAVWGGANDLFAVTQDINAGPAIIQQSIMGQAGIIQSLHEQGAQYIMLADIPDLGQTPEFAGSPMTSAIASDLTKTYNQGLAAALENSPANIIPLNISGLLNEVMQDPQAYGFTNVTDMACTVASLLCGPDQLVSPDAAQTYLYADGVHPTSGAHAAIADYAMSVVSAGTVMGQLGPIASQAGLSQMQRIDRRLGVAAATPEQGLQVWAEGAAVFANGSNGNSKLDGTNGAGSLGISQQLGQWTLGAYVQYDKQNSSMRSSHDVKQKRMAGGLYGRWAQDNLWVNAQVYYADLDSKVTRYVTLGAGQREHYSKASGDQFGGRVSAGYVWQQGAFTHGPLMGLSVQRTKVKALNENAVNSSAMHFDAQTHNSVQSSLGYQVSVAVSPAWSVYASGQWLHEFKKAKEQLGASLQTGNYAGRQFNLATQANNVRNTGLFELGASGQLSKHWQLSAGVTVETANTINAQNTVYVGTAYRF
ncbi:autotransporter domain-containing protein [Paenalcaligenes suwonensis]|uniref:autotransporter domain-containing protein n=1 Tax=Paenalcaligenes suwonensis TaxID=1202713 RepID=UPI00140B58E1|nr:autotransporter domain-containing protein [Paenalcaligenes suwonensis]NHC60297.1 autotransporter domain-containing protein [Paenalcaligenes suwonensis]